MAGQLTEILRLTQPSKAGAWKKRLDMFIKNQNSKYYYKVTRGTVSDEDRDITNTVLGTL
jgi:hypothetical protein